MLKFHRLDPVRIAERQLRLVLMEVVVVLVLTAFAAAQSSTGRIVGSVTDPQGAAVSNAKVTATNVGTNETKHTHNPTLTH